MSRELCRRWDWRNGAGRLKDMACRTLLLKLERRGQIRLPARQRPSPNALRNRQALDLPCDRTPIEGALGDLQPLRIEPLGEGHPDLALFRFLLQRHHYLGLRNSVGENLKYLARDRHGRPLACLLFGSAAWKAKARDEWIGWNAAQRRRGSGALDQQHPLSCFALGSRAASGQSPARARSPVASTAIGRPNTDMASICWKPSWIGSGFEEPAIGPRAGGTWARRPAAAATTWIRRCAVPVKDIYLRPLVPDFRRRLCA